MGSRIFWGSFLLFISVGMSFVVGMRARHERVFLSICSLVNQHFYKQDEELANWYRGCQDSARQRPWFAFHARLVADVERRLRQLNVSHLTLVVPLENRIIWNSEYLETGLRAREVDGYFFVREILANSPAERAGFRLGDLVAAINDQSIYREWDVQSTGGWFDILRDGQPLRLHVELAKMIVDESPKWARLPSGHDYLSIPSFRGDLFVGERWDEMVQRIRASRRLILDLRGNRGGNFVAMLRTLSPFFCKPKSIGRLFQPRLQRGASLSFTDDVNQDLQLAVVDRAREVVLTTFSQTGCFRGELTALVDEASASVSEILAQALIERQGTRVWGRRTAGDVLLAVIYPLAQMGDDFSLYIPQMYYESSGGQSLEAEGVTPMEHLDYRRSEAEKGVDSWLMRAQGL